MLKSEHLKITTIVENTTSNPFLLAQAGFCVLVEAGDFKFLLDTGANSQVVQNVDALGIDLNSVGTIVLSHGHLDHTCGLQAVLQKMKRSSVQIIAHPDAWGLKYNKNIKTGKYSFAGIPFRQEWIERFGVQHKLTADPTWLTEDIAVSGEEPMTTDFEKIADTFFIKTDNGYVPDPCADDQSIYIRTELGLVIILGCAHRGIINIIRHAQQLMKTEKIYMIIGGTHLGSASEEQILSTIEELKKLDFQWLGVSHCTGLNAAALLSQTFKKRFFFNNTGMVLTFPFQQ